MKPLKFLLVEDNQADARLMMQLLASQQNAPAVQWVSDGETALDCLLQRNAYKNEPCPDIMLLDLGLPRLSGYEVLESIQSGMTPCRPPVVVLTTSSSLADKVECFALGAKAFYSKPSDLKGYDDLIVNLMHMAGAQQDDDNSPP